MGYVQWVWIYSNYMERTRVVELSSFFIQEARG